MAPGQEETPQPEHIVNEAVDGPKNNDKYFIVKSLTVEDLELSARNGIWATQSHNEEALNRAYNVSGSFPSAMVPSNLPCSLPRTST